MTIQEFLIDRGLTQAALAKKLEISHPTMSLIKSGAKKASYVIRCRFAELFPGYEVEGLMLSEEEALMWKEDRRKAQGAGPVSVSFEGMAPPEPEEKGPTVWLIQGNGEVVAYDTEQAALLAIARFALDAGLWDLRELEVKK